VFAHWMIRGWSQCQRRLKSLVFFKLSSSSRLRREERVSFYTSAYHRSYVQYIGSFFHIFLYRKRDLFVSFFTFIINPDNFFHTATENFIPSMKNRRDESSKEIVVVIKGCLARDFHLQDTSQIRVPLSPKYILLGLFQIFTKIHMRYSQLCVYCRCQRHR